MESNTFLHHHPGDKKEGIAAESDPISSLFSNRRKFLKTTSIIAGGIMLNQITSPFKNAEAVALAAPTNIIPSMPGTSAVSFTWDPVSGATGYKLFSGTSTGVYKSQVDLGNVTSADFASLPSGTYYVAFTAYDSTGESGFSSEFFFNFVFSPPQNINHSVSASGTVSFTWDPVIGAAGYKLFSGSSTGDYTSSVDLGNVTSISYSNLPIGHYYVAFSSYTSSGASGLSGELVISFPSIAPSVIGYSVIGSTANLYWNSVIGAVGYKVLVLDPTSTWIFLDLPNVTSYSFPNLRAGTYSLFLQTKLWNGEVSDFSNQIDIEV